MLICYLLRVEYDSSAIVYVAICAGTLRCLFIYIVDIDNNRIVLISNCCHVILSSWVPGCESFLYMRCYSKCLVSTMRLVCSDDSGSLV